MGKNIDIPKDNNIVKITIEDAMPENYLPYAVEVAKDRALPDVRDGLKPVHRRILYGAYMLKAYPDKPYYKSARIVGDILGKYHPHGDTSVYDAMVILAQDFNTRMPLIDGHGNWGSQDGDSAAAMRYTEARMTNIAMEMIRDLDKDVVDMVDNYSNSEKEPAVLPAAYPNLLVNGTFGIAVGLATNIPPHNLCEVIDATLANIDNPEISTRELMQYVKGPDLPTGGIIIGKNALTAAYETGEGKVTLRSKTKIERLDNGRIGIIITEFPYRRSKAKMLQVISEMTGDKRHAKALEAITDIRDESDRTGIRSVIELKKSADEESAEKILKYLFKKTDLQCNVSFNMVAIANGKPETLGLKAILSYYINHQKDVVTRRTKRELQIAERRFHIVEGFIKAIDIIDEIITTIRASKSKKDSENNLCQKFGFTEIQAEAIVELMLYRLTGLEIKTFEKEYKELEKEIKRLKKILESEKELLAVIKSELKEIKDKYGDERRTVIVENDEEAKIDLDEILVVEDTMITLSNEGYIKRIPLKQYNRANTNVEDIEYREGDFNKFLFPSNTKDVVVFFTDKGNMYQLKGISVPEQKWKEKGERLDEVIKTIDLSAEKIISSYSLPNFEIEQDFIFFTSKGNIKKTNVEKFNTSYSKLLALKLKEDEKLLDVRMISKDREEQYIKIKTKLSLEFTFKEPQVEAADRSIMGLQVFNLPEKDEVVSADYTENSEDKEFYIFLDKQGRIKTTYSNVKSKYTKILTDSSKKLLLFSKNGEVYSLPSFMLQNVGENPMNISEYILSDGKANKIINIMSVSDFDKNVSIYFFTKKGLVKKTALKEFEGSYFSTLGYKLKSEKDSLINVMYDIDGYKTDLVLITKRAMCIRFDSNTVSEMGRVASGVVGINLKDEDEVIFAALISEGIQRDNDIVIQSNKKNKKTINLNEIKEQNRAGKGSNIMLVVMDEFIEDVSYFI